MCSASPARPGLTDRRENAGTNAPRTPQGGEKAYRASLRLSGQYPEFSGLGAPEAHRKCTTGSVVPLTREHGNLVRGFG